MFDGCLFNKSSENVEVKMKKYNLNLEVMASECMS